MLTQDRLKEMLRYNPCTGLFYWRPGRPRPRIPVGKQAGWLTNDGYIQIGIDKKTYYAHVLAWLYTYGEWPRTIDHLDENKSNNRVLNLLNVTQAENMRRYYHNHPQPNSANFRKGSLQ
jgi:hypothetical protein